MERAAVVMVTVTVEAATATVVKAMVRAAVAMGMVEVRTAAVQLERAIVEAAAATRVLETKVKMRVVGQRAPREEAKAGTVVERVAVSGASIECRNRRNRAQAGTCRSGFLRAHRRKSRPRTEEIP
eukprot:4705397-Prymnesium_polylepis.1